MDGTSRSAGGAVGLEADRFCDPHVFQWEQNKIFRTHWLCVGREEQLPETGSFLNVQAAGESLLLVRAEEAIHAHYNVCRHRGTVLCDRPDGQFSKSIMCPYHGWTYGLDGSLVAAPNMNAVAGFDCGDFPLQQVAVRVSQGFVFVNFDQPDRAFPLNRAVHDRLAAWQIESLRVVRRVEYDVHANWKLLFQNYNECYHCARVHPKLNLLSPAKSAVNDFDRGMVLGGPMTLSDQRDSLTTDGRRCAPLLPGLEADDQRRVFYFSIAPTMFLSPHPDYVMVHRLTPVSFAQTRIVCEFLFHPSDHDQAEPDRAVEFWDEVNRQDWEMCERSQRGIASSRYQPGPYSELESIVAAFDRWYRGVGDRG